MKTELVPPPRRPEPYCWDQQIGQEPEQAHGVELNNPPVRNRRHSMEFLIGQHSLFLAGFGQAFFFLHQFKPWLPIFSAVSFLLVPWSLVFVLFYHRRSHLSVGFIRRWWFRSACGCALVTLIAEFIWVAGLMPPPTAEHRIAADVLVQILMNFAWLSFIPMLRDHRSHPQLWS